MKKLLFPIIFLFIGFFALIVYAKDAAAVCYCVDPVRDNCACTDSASNHPEAIYPSSWNGVDVMCTILEEANSLFAVSGPVCDQRWNNEIIPYCAVVQGQTHQVTCWGTGFTLDGPDSIPYETRDANGELTVFDGFNPSTVITFNGFNQSGFTQILTCWENNFCCSRTDVTCEPSSFPDVEICNPQDGDASVHEDACFAGPIRPGATERGDGESRLWFSQTRLISTLASLAQTMYNPQNLNSRYNTTAFSKNAPRSDTSGGITNSGALTTRVEQHQGLGVVEGHTDYTPVVDSTEDSRNNSSVIEGFPAPFPLFGFGNTSDENIYNDDSACYIPDTINNPGDDLMGPRIEGELLLTEQFNYRVPPMPDGCVEDGEAYTRMTDPDLEDCPCCSAAPPSEGGLGEDACQPAGNPCRLTDENDIDCAIDEVVCITNPTSYYCCPEETPDLCNTHETGVCASLPPVQIRTPRSEAQVFSKTPIIELVYDTLIEGEDSLFKRFMPDYSPISNPTEKPTSSGYRVSVSNTNPSGTALTIDYGGGQATSPEIYFPHIGTLAENWLWKFQEALRPEGVGINQISSSGAAPTPTPVNPPIGPGSCTVPRDGFCSPAHILSLAPVTGPWFSQTERESAAQICQIESSGVLTSELRYQYRCTRCSDGIDNDGDSLIDLNDPDCDGARMSYAVGLMQINLHPLSTFPHGERCRQATGVEVFNLDYSDKIGQQRNWCEILPGMQDEFENCIAFWQDAANLGQRNFQEAYNLYTESGGWCPWSASYQCNLCP